MGAGAAFLGRFIRKGSGMRMADLERLWRQCKARRAEA